jgi:cephalosporin-C deacetylase-like acetyl esterase
MRTIAIILFCIYSLRVTAQKPYNVLDWKAEYTLNTYLLQEVHKQYDARRMALQRALQSPEAMQVYREECKTRYRKLLGELPAKTNLNVKLAGAIKQKGYRVERIVYESIPNHHVTSNLYIPEGNGPFPGVLLFCGHEAEAKATESYQKTAILFALHGFVVLVIDPISQGERYQLTDKDAKPVTRGGTTEHTLVNAAANLNGSGAVAYELWDNVRGLDYLITRPEVDKERIGCLGNSGGGTQTAYYIAFDERIKVAAPCSFIARRERNLELTGASDGCQHIPYEGSAQLEISDFLIAFAPKPVLILAGRYDFVDYTGTEEVYHELKQVYSVLNAPDKVSLFTVDDGHGISKPKREAAVQWFRKWLYDKDEPVKEGDLVTCLQKELNSTATGQVNGDFKNEVNDFKRASATAKVLEQKRTTQGLPERVKTALRITAHEKAITIEEKGSAQRDGYTIYKTIIRKDGEVPLPVLTVYPDGEIRETILWLHEQGKQKIADSSALIRAYLTQNYAVVMADLRGLGEMKDPAAFNDAKYFNQEYRNAMIALHIGKPLVTQRTIDVITLTDYIHQHERLSKSNVHIMSTGVAALSVVHAAVLDSRLKKLTVWQLLPSFTAIYTDPARLHWYSSVVPNVLAYYDIPDLVAYIKDHGVVVNQQ